MEDVHQQRLVELFAVVGDRPTFLTFIYRGDAAHDTATNVSVAFHDHNLFCVAKAIFQSIQKFSKIPAHVRAADRKTRYAVARTAQAHISSFCLNDQFISVFLCSAFEDEIKQIHDALVKSS